jgi:hypothetical protein
MDFPSIAGPGYLHKFDFDVASQELEIELSHAVIHGSDGSQILRLLFHQVFHLQFTGDIPVVFGQNEVHRFEEIRDSELLSQGRDERKDWLFFVSEVDTAVLAGPRGSKPELRHFFLHTAFMGAQWLCTGLTASAQRMED